MAKYDYLVVGCGIFGSVFAQQMAESGKKILLIDKRDHIGGNCYTENIEGINVHKYGPHIFHTSNQDIWEYINRFAEFNNFVNRPKVFYKNKIYSFPINLMTLQQLFGISTPAQAKEKLKQLAKPLQNPDNLEEWILSQVSEDIYNTFFKGYTTKQWGKKPKDLPSSIIKRVPIRLTFDDNYYNDKYQGIPIGGYTNIFNNMLKDVEVNLGTDFFENKDNWQSIASNLVYTGKIDEFFGYKFGQLEYRTLEFETKIMEGDFQGNAVINYTEQQIPYTRIIEHKHFEFGKQPKTVVTWEFPAKYDKNTIPYYPINNKQNNELYDLYKKESKNYKNVIFGGRLGTYQYLDMDEVIGQAIGTAKKLLSDNS